MRKSFKKSLALVLAVLMLLSIAPMSLAVVDPSTCDHSYNLVEAKTPTHEEDGWVKHYRCPTCQSYFIKTEAGTFKMVTEAEVMLYAHTFSAKPAFVWTPKGKDYTAVAKFTCAVCERVTTIAAVVTSEVTKEATCAAPGETTYTATATLKNQTYTDTYKVPIESPEHEYYEVEATSPNCVSDGYQAHYACKNCDLIFKKVGSSYQQITLASITIKKADDPRLAGRTAHTDSGEVIRYSIKNGEKIAYDCTLGGFECKFCSYCEQEYGKKPLEKRSTHTDVHHNTVPATCTEDGMTAYNACSVCGYSANPGSIIEAQGHAPEMVRETESSCTVKGNIRYWKCSRCHVIGLDKDLTQILTDDIDPETGDVIKSVEEKFDELIALPTVGHDFKIVTIRHDAACTEDGNRAIYKCETCNQLAQQYIAKSSDPNVTTDEEIPDDAYFFNADSLKVTYKDNKTQARYYQDITKTADATLTKLGHNWVPDANPGSEGYVAPKCNKEGACTAFCPRCGSKTIQSIDKIPHQSKQMIKSVAPTCERGTYEIHICKVCGETYEIDIDNNVLGHRWSGQVSVIREATCTQEGLKGQACLNGCGKAMNGGTVLPKINHTTKPVKVEPTCTEDGYTGNECSMCHQVFDKKVLEKTGHKDDNKDAKCDKCGLILCDHICHKTDIFSKLVWFIARVWYQYLGLSPTCKCGLPHYNAPLTK